jgi:hypothetical protein
MAATVDGVGPMSGVGSATGAGPADVTKLDASKGNATPSIAKGLYASQGGPIRSAQKTGGPSSVALPQKTKAAIEDALAEVRVAKVRLAVAYDRYSRNSGDDDFLGPALTHLKGARANLGQVIAREADHSSSLRSSLVLKEQRPASKNLPPSATKVREFEAKVINGTPLADRDEVAGAILKSKELRATGELARTSAAMLAVAKTKNPFLNPSQTEERKSILADVRDCVTQPRPEEAHLAPNELAEAQLARFESVADSVTRLADKFDPFLFVMLKNEVRAGMVAASMNLDYLGKFDALVASYSTKLAPRY